MTPIMIVMFVVAVIVGVIAGALLVIKLDGDPAGVSERAERDEAWEAEFLAGSDEPIFSRLALEGIRYEQTHAECADCGVRCDDCGERMCSEFGPEPAITCAAHRLCICCDDMTCKDCAHERREEQACATCGGSGEVGDGRTIEHDTGQWVTAPCPNCAI